MGKCGGDMPRAQRVDGPVAVVRVGQGHVDDGAVVVAGREEGQAVHVVPVQVGEQDRPGEGAGAQSALARRIPVPASRISCGALASVGVRATHEV